MKRQLSYICVLLLILVGCDVQPEVGEFRQPEIKGLKVAVDVNDVEFVAELASAPAPNYEYGFCYGTSTGVLVKAVRWLDVYAGAGYGWRSLYWQDIDGRWVQVDDWSHRGLSVEAGAILLYRRLAFSAGLSSISFKTAAFTMGVGLKF